MYKRGCIVIILALMIIMFNLVSGGPYGYGNSMDLKYRIIEDKIIYGYGESRKFMY